MEKNKTIQHVPKCFTRYKACTHEISTMSRKDQMMVQCQGCSELYMIQLFMQQMYIGFV